MPNRGNMHLVRGLKGNQYGPTTIKNLDSQKIRKLLVDMAEPELRKKAQEVHDDLDQVSRHAIDYFYFTYDPMYYERQGGLRYAFTSDINKTEFGYSVRFTYDANLVKGKHRATNDLIFEQAFIQGFHGGYNGVINPWGGDPVLAAQTDPSPWELLLNYVNTKYPNE